MNLSTYVHILILPGDADEVGIPVTNTWYFNGYNTDECFDKYFENPTEHRPPTVYLGFPCTKVSILFSYTGSPTKNVSVNGISHRFFV